LDIIYGSSDLYEEEKNHLAKNFNLSQKKLCIGQLEEVNTLRDQRLDLQIQDYERIIDGKTGSLFGYAFETGSFLANNELSKKVNERCKEVGIKIGRLFQVLDDYIDLFAHSEGFGKPKFQDLKEGKRTLFFIHTRDTLEKENRNSFSELYLKPERDDSDSEKILSFMNEAQSKEYGQKYIKNLSDSIKKDIFSLSDEFNLNQSGTIYLSDFVSFLSKRTI
jgi:geranylgeranyl pyrophosphate synthase